MLTQPENQIVYNTLYFQKLFENDTDFGVLNNTPNNEYLSRLINLNMKTLLNSNFNNCILSGFDVIITNTNNDKLYLNIFPGTAILNSYLFELNNIQENIELIVDTFTKYIVVSLIYNNHDKEFKIKFDSLDENKDKLIIESKDYDEILPIKLFRLEYKDSKINILSLEDDKVYMGLGGEIYNLLNLIYLETEYTNKLSDYKALNNLYDIPKNYTINGEEYLIPNYGKHYRFASNLLKILYQNKIMNMLFDYPIPNSYNIFAPTETNFCHT